MISSCKVVIDVLVIERRQKTQLLPCRLSDDHTVAATSTPVMYASDVRDSPNITPVHSKSADRHCSMQRGC